MPSLTSARAPLIYEATPGMMCRQWVHKHSNDLAIDHVDGACPRDQERAHDGCFLLPTPGGVRCHRYIKRRGVRIRAGAASRSFTSTALAPVTKNERVLVRLERTPKSKAYLRLHTSLGDLNLELDCDLAPRTCENFLILAESGYYSGTVFHRSIRNFMIQVRAAVAAPCQPCTRP